MRSAEVDVERTWTRFAVDADECIGCGLCHERAPNNIEVPAGAMSARVFKQPSSDAEKAACTEAADYCPTGGLRPIGQGERET